MRTSFFREKSVEQIDMLQGYQYLSTDLLYFK